MCNKLGSIGFLSHSIRSCLYRFMKPFNNEYVLKIGKRFKDIRFLNLFLNFQHKTVYMHIGSDHSLTWEFHSFWDLSDTRGYSSKLQHVEDMSAWCPHGRIYMILCFFISLVMKSRSKQWSTIPPVSSKRTLTALLRPPHTKRPHHMTLKIQALPWDRCKND